MKPVNPKDLSHLPDWKKDEIMRKAKKNLKKQRHRNTKRGDYGV